MITSETETKAGVSPLRLESTQHVLAVRLPREWPVLSWAPYNGGDVITSCLINRQVLKGQTCRDVRSADSFQGALKSLNLPMNTVGFLTAADVSQFQQVFLAHGPLWVHAIATVGLTNARAAGDEADVPLEDKILPAGTINLWIACNALPGITGRLEAIQTATAAKVAALRDMDVKSKKSGKPAAGTGTDCVAIAASGELPYDYCGMHTVVGELIGKAVYQVIRSGTKT